MTTTTFNPTNRAYQRFLHVAEEHFTVVPWASDAGDPAVPVMISLLELGSGDGFTLTLLESTESIQEHIVLALHTDALISAHGVLTAADADADDHHAILATAEARITASLALPLLPPEADRIPDTAWAGMPPAGTSLVAAPAPADAETVVIIADAAQGRICATGPFTDNAAAADWIRSTPLSHGLAAIIVGLHRQEAGA